MTTRQTFELHALRLGKLAGDLLSLEMCARMVVAESDGDQALRTLQRLVRVKVGDRVERNALTGNEDLTKTLEKYNKRVPLDCRVEIERIVRLRDALAHGRAFGFGPMGPDSSLRLVKFSRRVEANTVEVTMAVDMTEEWFRENTILLADALGKVTKALDWEMRAL